jgi:Flp pilus assembly protein TadD
MQKTIKVLLAIALTMASTSSAIDVLAKSKKSAPVVTAPLAAVDDPGCRSCTAQANTLFATGKDDEAIAYLKEWAPKCPNSTKVHLLLSTIYLRKGAFKEAEAAAAMAAKLSDSSVPAHMQYAMALSGSGRPLQAIEEFTKVTDLDPGNYEAWTALASLHKQMRHEEEGNDAANKAAELEPGRKQARLATLNNLRRAGKFTEATAEVKKLIAVHEHGPEVMLDLSEEALSIGAFPDAINAANKVVQSRPKSVKAHYILGLAEFCSHEYDNTLSAADKILELDAANAEGLALKSLALNSLGRAEDAEAAVTTALQKQPKLAMALLAKGALELSQEKLTEAQTSLQSALDSEPGNSVMQQLPRTLAHLELSSVYSKKGMIDEALDEAQEAAEDKRFGGDAALAIAQIYEKKGMRADSLKYYKRSLEQGLSGKHAELARDGVIRNQ